ncbi:hypothetical protein TRFO_28456 [Tritrichomonas foetus]|uniref:Uncharacterized protein n=1 Tax=Tritrichomonas foetus TaxID=1144522 RepID=A0A1J4JY60_9EUKA|nr:hypothetical protein TRFO_28456 [Tritrichomonas foetus]|eukprot:OHT04089.1 hypothetical protein TRFO_28456 [Tritrichomonas foetus]
MGRWSKDRRAVATIIFNTKEGTPALIYELDNGKIRPEGPKIVGIPALGPKGDQQMRKTKQSRRFHVNNNNNTNGNSNSIDNSNNANLHYGGREAMSSNITISMASNIANDLSQRVSSNLTTLQNNFHNRLPSKITASLQNTLQNTWNSGLHSTLQSTLHNISSNLPSNSLPNMKSNQNSEIFERSSEKVDDINSSPIEFSHSSGLRMEEFHGANVDASNRSIPDIIDFEPEIPNFRDQDILEFDFMKYEEAYYNIKFDLDILEDGPLNFNIEISDK